MMRHLRRDLVGLIAVGGFVVVTVLLFEGRVIDVSVKDVALVLVGQLAAKFGTVVDYHYGSSEGSNAKTQALTDLAKKDPP